VQPPVPAAVEPDDLPGVQRSALTRLSILTAPFDRAVAVAVAACTEETIDALARMGFLRREGGAGPMEVRPDVRDWAANRLTRAEAHAARLRQAEHFTVVAEQAREASGLGEGALASLEVYEADKPHFEAAFSFLEAAPGLERQLLKLMDAVAHAGVLRLDRTSGVRWLETALAAARVIQDRKAERDLLDNLGTVYTDAANFGRARDCYEQVAAISRELGDRHGEARAIGNAGLSWQRAGQAAKAVACLEQVLAMMRELGDRNREGLALSGLAQAASDGGDHHKAIEYYREHLAITTESGDRRAEAFVLSALGRESEALGDRQTAIECFERQLAITERARDLAGEAIALGSLGQAYRAAGSPGKAVDCFQRQVDVAELLGEEPLRVRALGHLGLAHLAADRASRALQCFDEQLEVARRIDDREGEGLALGNAARVVYSRGQLADAITRASAALPILEGIGSAEAAALRAEIEQWRAEAG
jgi:tetratricopeptide (TPR) repeat protein